MTTDVEDLFSWASSQMFMAFKLSSGSQHLTVLLVKGDAVTSSSSTNGVWMENPTDNDRFPLKTPTMTNIFRCEDNTVDLMPHYYCVRQVDPCYRLGEVARRPS